MSRNKRDKLGIAPDTHSTALLLIDVINDFEFTEAESLPKFAMPMAERIARLKIRAKAAKVPIIYVNDNFGRWRSDFKGQVEHCLSSDAKGREIVKLLRPDDDDYFVLKPKHSGFYASSLEVLLEYLGTKELVLTGLAGNICVLFTANDAYMRDYKIIVPPDCTASDTEAANQAAIDEIKTVLKGDVRKSVELQFKA